MTRCRAGRPRLAIALVATVLLTASVTPSGGAAPPPRLLADQLHFLRSEFRFSEGDLSALAQGHVVAHVVDSGDHSEVLAVAAVRVDTTVARVRAQLQAFEGRRRPVDILQAGHFGREPSPADLASLTIDPGDLAALSRCKPGDCDLRLSADAILRFRREVDWSSPQRAEKATALWHDVLARLDGAYLARGNDALFQYDNNDMPVKVGDSLARVLARSGFLAESAPDLYPYLLRFPQGRPDRVEDDVYWIKEKFWIKTVVSLNHVAIVSGEGPGGPYVLAAAKQIYANHYFESSLSVTAFVESPPASYLVYVSRSRADIRASGFNLIERLLIRRLVEARLDAQFKWVRDQLQEPGRRAALSPAAP